MTFWTYPQTDKLFVNRDFTHKYLQFNTTTITTAITIISNSIDMNSLTLNL